MHKSAILFILIIALIAFTNVLDNSFVGDDEVVIVRNSFYKTLDNLPRLFSKDYITSSRRVLMSVDRDYHSGSVAYRPVLSATYFLDYQLWDLNPLGYHLSNLILHLFNSVFVYFLVFSLLKDRNTALLAAVLFSIHPLKTEPVSNIGYRADCLSAFFALGSFLCFLRSDESRGMKRNFLFGLSLAAFGFGLFTKEAIIVLPVLIMAYDFYFRDRKIPAMLSDLKSRYLGFVLISLFYLYVYFIVFTNSTLKGMVLLGGSVLTHLVMIFRIFGEYVYLLIFPFNVHILPPQYVPEITSLWDIRVILSALLFVFFIFSIIWFYKRSKFVSFFLFWFMISFLPISNIIPIPNPFAHRFIYWPSIGLLTVAAIFIEKLSIKLEQSQGRVNLVKILKVVLIGFFMIYTLTLNRFWKSNYTVAAEMIEHYPNHPKGYMILGFEYCKAGLYERAQLTLNKSLQLGARDPRLYHMLGLAYPDQPEKAIQAFSLGIHQFPYYALSYTGLGRIHFLQGEYEKALPYFEKSVELAPRYAAYGYIIQIHIFQDRIDKAEQVHQQAKQNLWDSNQLASLEQFVKEHKEVTSPVDIGF